LKYYFKTKEFRENSVPLFYCRTSSIDTQGGMQLELPPPPTFCWVFSTINLFLF